MDGEITPGREVPAYLRERIVHCGIDDLAKMIEDLFAIADEMYGMLSHHESLPCNCRACGLKSRLEELKC